MRKILLVAVVVSALVVLPFLVQADIPDPGHIIKWSQMPVETSPLVDPETWGPLNLRSWYSVVNPSGPGGAQMAIWDDFLCTNTSPIDDVHWWGGILGDAAPGDLVIPRNGQPDFFNVTFWTSYYPTDGGFSRPLLWQKSLKVNIADVDIQNISLIDHLAVNAPYEYIYQYYIDFTKVVSDPSKLFTQQGTAANPIPYFMAIQAGWNPTSQPGWWGWTEAVDGVGDVEWRRVGGPGAVALNDDAVRGTYTGAWAWQEVGGIRRKTIEGVDTFENRSLDMAFELSSGKLNGDIIPEPGTMVLLGLGLFGLGAKLRRRRRA